MSCKCRNGDHEPWCPKFVENVDTKAPVMDKARGNAARKRAIVDVCESLAATMSEEELTALKYSLVLKSEKRIRAEAKPGSILLEILDEYYSKEPPEGEE
jgi:hypothetical protein